MTSVTNPGMLSLAYAVGFTYTLDLLYTSLYLLSSAVWGVCSPELLPASCLISTMESTCANKTKQVAKDVEVNTDRDGGERTVKNNWLGTSAHQGSTLSLCVVRSVSHCALRTQFRAATRPRVSRLPARTSHTKDNRSSFARRFQDVGVSRPPEDQVRKMREVDKV